MNESSRPQHNTNRPQAPRAHGHTPSSHGPRAPFNHARPAHAHPMHAVKKTGDGSHAAHKQGNAQKKTVSKSKTYQYSGKGAPRGRSPQSRNNTPARQGVIPPVEAGVIRIIPLGGVEEIGKNMTAIEIGNDIIVVDAGMQFAGDDTPGIDYIIPNTRYLEERKDRIRAMIITHGHLDHIGGLPVVMRQHPKTPVWLTQSSRMLIDKMLHNSASGVFGF